MGRRGQNTRLFEPIIHARRDEGVSRFAVDSVESAQAVRKAGLVDEELLMLRSLTDRAALEQLADLNVICSGGFGQQNQLSVR